ncbi:MAG TPA: hypothetical protein VFZ83_07025 [Acidimicrobiia bacterium]|nr:hypothetical protein [Acidimicrobiia bacterium]
MFLVLMTMFTIVFSLPATWLLMLFLGNIGVATSFWGALPGGILLTFFTAGSGAGSMRRR